MTTATYRSNLPQMNGRTLLTDGGIETTLIFHEGFDLPLFASYVLLDDDTRGRKALRDYYARYIDIARDTRSGFVLESPTWRCSRDWGAKLGHDADAIASFNRKAIVLMEELRQQAGIDEPIVVSGNIGPRGDGYAPDTQMTPEEAEAYHRHQIETFAGTGADMVSAVTMTHAGEAIGIARAAKAAGIPVAISFTVETDGHLPSGQPLGEGILETDAATGDAPAYYMINCAHPDHFKHVLADDGRDWTSRIRGIRANASRMSHAELDESETLDDGNPDELGVDYANLSAALPNLRVFGGCCGTDHRHVRAIAAWCCN
ncbi:homocysteine S-methyltransferase family protein [Oricola sp.]|uniref:homocysteine S-methyltransferase family protein n=1 Tax=Oricola sp. TaxID=1979950 RepID=UPI000C9449FF|nr:homocysteine S-methyltransferase [Ahrensia sp.]|tara:strand:- start:46063 stop:47013 length:951 start_codon:yes stop_codon:yes gene_type:complete